MLEYPIHTMRGFGANVGITSILQQQGVFGIDSPIPIIVAAVGGAVGLVSALSRKSAPHFSKFCEVMIELCFNLSLSANEFNLIMSIVAASNNDEIPEGVFYPNLALTTFLYLLLISNLLFPLTPCCKTKKADITEVDDDEDEDDIEAAKEILEDKSEEDEECEKKAEEQPPKSPSSAHRNLSLFSPVKSSSNKPIIVEVEKPIEYRINL